MQTFLQFFRENNNDLQMCKQYADYVLKPFNFSELNNLFLGYFSENGTKFVGNGFILQLHSDIILISFQLANNEKGEMITWKMTEGYFKVPNNLDELFLALQLNTSEISKERLDYAYAERQLYSIRQTSEIVTL